MTGGPFTSRPARLIPLLWGFILLVGALDFAWLRQSGLEVDNSQDRGSLILLAACLAVAAIYRTIRRDERLYLFAQSASQLIAGTAVLGLLSYLSSRLNLPLVDERLIAIDHALGFDWRGWIMRIDGWPVYVSGALSLAYQSAKPQLFALLLILFATNHMAHMQRFIAAFFFAGLWVIILAAIWPAVGGYIYYHIEPGQFTNLHPAAARVHETALLGLRDHSLKTVEYPLQGLVTFPSFHSAIALLFIYAAWPVRRLRWIAVPLNLLVLLSTPGDGGHYLIDVIGGGLLAWLGIVLVGRIVPKEAAA